MLSLRIKIRTLLNFYLQCIVRPYFFAITQLILYFAQELR